MSNCDSGFPEQDPSLDAFLQGAGDRFAAEHRLPEPPKPLPEEAQNYLGMLNKKEFTTTTTDFHHISTEPYIPPSLDEQIESMERSGDFERAIERNEHFKRKRENFGQTFSIVSRFKLSTENIYSKLRRDYGDTSGERPEKPEDDPVLVTGLTNRVNLYRYLQQRGMVLIDDTGLSAYAHSTDQQDTKHGFLFLPDSIDRSVFYAFEDEVRQIAPFSRYDVDLARMKRERDTGIKPSPEELSVADREMRELVDYLATDERFVAMFELADSIRRARAERPRELPDMD